MSRAPNVIVTGRDLWTHEQRQARHLGCKLEVKTEGNTAYARLIPITAKARHAFRAAAAEDGHAGQDSIEVRQAFDGASERTAALHAAITAALSLGRDVAK